MTVTTLPSKKQSPEALQMKDEIINNFSTALQECHGLASQLQLIKIIDEGSLSVAIDQAKNAKSLLAQVETKRKAMKEPVINQGKMIDAVAKDLTRELENEYQAIRNRITEYEKNRPKEEPKTDLDNLKEWYSSAITGITNSDSIETLGNVYKEQVKTFNSENYGKLSILASQVKEFAIAYGKIRKEELSTGKKLTKERAEITGQAGNWFDNRQRIQEAQHADKPQPAEEIKVPVTTVDRWKFEVSNMRDVPLFFLQINESAIREFIKEQKDKLQDGQIVHGIKFFKETGLILK